MLVIQVGPHFQFRRTFAFHRSFPLKFFQECSTKYLSRPLLVFFRWCRVFRKEYPHSFGSQAIIFSEVCTHGNLAGFNIGILVDPETLSRNRRAADEQKAGDG